MNRVYFTQFRVKIHPNDKIGKDGEKQRTETSRDLECRTESDTIAIHRSYCKSRGDRSTPCFAPTRPSHLIMSQPWDMMTGKIERYAVAFEVYNPIDSVMSLPPAVRPANGVCWEPHEGYRVRVFRDRRTGIKLPMLTAAVDKDRAFDTFYALLKPLGSVVHCVLESSHGLNCDNHHDFRRNHIDSSVLKSYLCEYEEMLVNDGCTGVAVLANGKPIEVQFDEHKIITIYAPDVTRFRKILKQMGLRRDKSLTVVAEAEHLHFSTASYAEQFRQMAIQMGAATP